MLVLVEIYEEKDEDKVKGRYVTNHMSSGTPQVAQFLYDTCVFILICPMMTFDCSRRILDVVGCLVATSPSLPSYIRRWCLWFVVSCSYSKYQHLW